jgi:hypothetical protein
MDCVTRKREYGCIVLFCLHRMQALHVAGGCIESCLHLLVGWRRRYDEACVRMPSMWMGSIEVFTRLRWCHSKWRSAPIDVGHLCFHVHSSFCGAVGVRFEVFACAPPLSLQWCSSASVGDYLFACVYVHALFAALIRRDG